MQQRTQIEHYLERLAPRYRTLIVMRFFDEYSYEEIAANLKLPLGTVKTQIHRAREQMCRLITEGENNCPPPPKNRSAWNLSTNISPA